MNNAYCYKTPIGEIVIVDNGRSIVQVFFGDNIPKNVNVIETNLLKEANNQLKEYFIGKREKFDLYLEPQGTEFQKKVWKELQEIPYGETRSYKNIAINIGNEKACRAVGMANNKNPIPIFIPCHRVIGSNGNLIGYAGGLDIKETLLRIENKD
ncbi:methylated-DNA--[protein]-cysteine S-methyltransferase [Clostridium sp. FAM 1755]|uniref:Methylated-DNA--protein-cysteine methyltransferase n=2 Tax=Clostridium TaxID=1485 RepID=A0A6M0T2C0_CLOBO|nr:methylated-DNA--[protein]-cysteine S-methyltransferase [Clostridium sporogenes]NFA61928.1 methylated-DNA--[protein]-cysteine S-methyltransferase [Clostridium botulinum]MDS1003059.1 methylated-DNA--[protein]-cysteine S-methyltransferase [Clostridium sporogenes]NFI72613.1 methylated-DNA--[protein]-cysteine S-methyltransferase [Clostridium sporogenes]NFL72875.1 methylated-DNA--[protein]-cysteine S-methyltransferase [Clostridium sporogenes]NFM25763.1 methylated-DNA--[protein]-cysteine S-methylt